LCPHAIPLPWSAAREKLRAAFAFLLFGPIFAVTALPVLVLFLALQTQRIQVLLLGSVEG
jgi:hypothetical protein